WAATGLWHGAAWSFVLWGLFFAVIMIVEKFLIGERLKKLPAALQHLYTMFVFLISMVIFNANGLGQVFGDLKHMFGGAPLWTADTTYYLKNYAVIFVLGILGSTPLFKTLWSKISHRAKGLSAVAEPLYLALLLVAVTACLLNGSLNPFMYFRF
ncbi:MAG: MBOAT family protein, partial [Oscillospiraceae bacterium]|nr:MBOAT family protein [Oscillospiraceae bacterium]